MISKIDNKRCFSLSKCILMQEHKKKYCVMSIFGEPFIESWQVHWIILSEWLILTKVKQSFSNILWMFDPLVKCTLHNSVQSWPVMAESSITSLNSLAKYHHDSQPGRPCWARGEKLRCPARGLKKEKRMERINLRKSVSRPIETLY